MSRKSTNCEKLASLRNRREVLPQSGLCSRPTAEKEDGRGKKKTQLGKDSV